MQDIMQQPKMQAEYSKIKSEILSDNEISAFIKAHQPELSSDIFERDLATIYEYYLQRQKSKTGQSDVHPGYTPELLFVEGQVVVQYRATEATINLHKKLRAASRVQSIGMPKQLKNAQMDDFSQSDAGMTAAVMAVAQFIQAYVENPKDFHQGLYLQGPYGVGKTYLIGAMANQLSFDDIQVMLIHYPTFAANMKEAINDPSKKMDDVRSDMRTAEILVLDDIGAETDGSGWIRDDVLGVVLDYRMQNGLTTFFTSNFSMKQLEEEHFAMSNKGVEPVKAARLMQRIMYLSKEVPVNGPNRRLEAK
ncbi:primosomal protein DnaI [Weissella diestrammenae]|uniref:Primosomal protein DnaI n=2 Tax=Weissella diestrammenae TaxID=1162633 RepID=A0A7G9T7Q4_9LACO|nr:primosomal protein DnaI [Weissella diestrammenae]QNN76129.1 primosomal protein DnaI [Weissella diestrammenae]